jgi:hypothetical protein
VVGARLLGFQVQAVRHLWEAGRLGIGETESEKMDCPALSLQDAMSALTTAAYGRPLKLSWNGRRLKGPKYRSS